MVGIANDLNINQLGIQSFNNVNGVFTGVTITAGTGITVTNGNGQTGNPIISSSGDLHTSPFIVSPGGAANGANYTTIGAAYAAAVAQGGKQTIFVQPGTYTENITLTPGVNITAFGSDGSLNATGNVIISGKATLTGAGSVTISGIQLQTNSDFFLAVTGSVASVVNLNSCYLNCSNHTGISHTSSSPSSVINISSCNGNLGTTGIGLFTSTSGGNIFINGSYISNTGASTTSSTVSTGVITCNYNKFNISFSTSSVGVFGFNNCSLDNSANNSTVLTTAGTGSAVVTNCYCASGSASAISVGTGTTLNISASSISSTNTNAITGVGSITYYGIAFSGPSQVINTTTQTGGVLQGGTVQAPSAGFIGERISSVIVSTGVSVSTNTPTNITNISLTAGIWDVSLI